MTIADVLLTPEVIDKAMTLVQQGELDKDFGMIELCQGLNDKGEGTFIVMQIAPSKYPDFVLACEKGFAFEPSDFGTIIAQGLGEPSAQLKKELNEKFGFISDFEEKLRAISAA